MKLLLPPEDPNFSVLIVSSCAQPLENRKINYEPAGRAFHALQRRISGLSWEAISKKKKIKESESITRQVSKDSPSEGDDDDILDYSILKDQKDYYALLGISHLGLNASEKQIKKAYQETILKTHPDKLSPEATKEERDAANALFRDVQKAYEVLSDIEKRRGYDSQFDFDDSIPSGLETLKDEQAFFVLYGPVFKSNARFSISKPVPLLGELTDDETTVKNMYIFWRTFRSWRDFSAFDEFKDGDLETAESRDHRRYMMKKNEAQREKRKKKEFARIQLLVERAYKNDPRIAKFKAEAERQKEEIYRAREAARKAAEDAKRAEEQAKEAERLEQGRLETEKREEEKKERLQLKKNKKDCLRNIEKSLRDLGLEELVIITKLDLINSLEFNELNQLLQEIREKNIVEPLNLKCQEIEDKKNLLLQEEEARRKAKLEEDLIQKEKSGVSTKRAIVWTTEALGYLAKGMAKHPGGTRNRWQCVANFVATSGFQVTADDCIEASKRLSATGPSKPSTLTIGSTQPSPAKVAEISFEDNSKETSKLPQSKENREWTSEEQKLLEAALREFPNTMEVNERWTAIAKRVGTRTKKECAARVKELKAKLKQ